MYSKNRMKIMIGAFTGLGVILLITLIYAAFTRKLNISGTSVNRKSKFDIHFEDLSTITPTGTAKVLTQPRIASATSIEDYSVSETSPGDSISFTFKVVNDGNYNASVSSVSVGTPECSGTDSTSNSNVCGKLIYSLTYEDGSSVQTGDTLAAKDSITMKVTLTYQKFNDASLLPTEDVSISNLGITVNYTQSGNALVKDNGEVADYKVYHQGDKITLNNEDYWVIVNSGADQDYVVALKDLPLTVAEVNTYGASISVSANNIGGYGGIAFGSNNEYQNSAVKIVVEAWSVDKFSNDELKLVDGFNSRLITESEYSSIPNTDSWRYNTNYTYWSFTKYTLYGHASIYCIQKDSSISGYGNYGTLSTQRVVRPVIHVYKSALETNNNNNNE